MMQQFIQNTAVGTTLCHVLCRAADSGRAKADPIPPHGAPIWCQGQIDMSLSLGIL